MGLPSGYKRLQYIQSTGTQYIDTNVSAPEGFRITCDVEFTSLPNTLNMLFGSHDTASPYYRNFLAARNTGKWEIGAYNSTDFGSVSVNTKYSIDVCTISGAIGCSINGIDQIVDSSIAVSTIRSSRTIYVFGLNYTDGLLPSNMKLYGLKMYLDADGSNLVRDFVPCRTPDGTVGLWDNINSVFYTNAGTGAFIGGPLSSVSLPSGYRRLEYIESSGTQYIDTGVSAPSGFQADIDFELASLSTTSTNDAIIGAHNDSAPYSRNYFAAKAAGFEVGVGEAYLQGEVPTTNERYMVDVSTVYSDIHLVVNSVEHSLTTDISATDEHSANTLYLLWCHGGSEWFSKCACKLYACRIYVSDKLVRDFIPCISDTDEVGLWDDVNAVFYGNAGTGTFIGGGYTSFKTGDILNYAYAGAVQSVTLPKGVYKLEVWGAQGGSYSSYYGGAGGYSVGTITFTSDTPLYIYVGGQPATNSSDRVVVSGGFNGGGNGYNRYYSGTYTYGQGGGGGTDIRIGQDSLYARVIVAGGGGGSASVNALTTKYGGGTTGGAPTSSYAGTQTTGGNAGNKGTFGQGGSVTTGGSNYRYSSGGGGGGWYGGGAASDYTDSSSSYRGYNGGGSGFVWTGSNAPSGYLLGPEYYLTDASTIAGNASMPSTSGGTETGHTGNGYARITVIKVDSLNLPVNIGGTWKDANEAFVNIGGTWKTVEAAFVNIGGTWKELS